MRSRRSVSRSRESRCRSRLSVCSMRSNGSPVMPSAAVSPTVLGSSGQPWSCRRDFMMRSSCSSRRRNSLVFMAGGGLHRMCQRARAGESAVRSRSAGAPAARRDALTVSRRPGRCPDTALQREARIAFKLCPMEESRTAVVAALLGNASLALLKGIAAAVTGSAAMLAETFHSIADTGNQVLLLVGMRLGRQPPDTVHPFGYGKNIYFWAFVVSAMLFTVGGAFSIWEGVHKLRAPSEHTASGWAFLVLAGAFVFESLSLAVATRALRRAK